MSVVRFPKASVTTEALALVGPAETAFASRWQLRTLKRLDPELHDLLMEQQDIYDTAMLTGSDEDVKVQSEAMARGWRAACARMEQPLQPDDAYMTGVSGFTHVCIGHHKQSAARVDYIKGRKTVFITPDEVAAMLDAYDKLRDVKALFPDAELIGIDTPTTAREQG